MVGRDYKIIKEEGEEKIRRLETDLSDAMEQQRKRIDIYKLLDLAANTLTRLDEIYNKVDAETKRKLVGSIYAEKLCYDGNKYRTANTNGLSY